MVDNVAIRCSNCGKTGLSVKNTNYKDMITKFLLNIVLQNVFMSWIIETNQKLKYDIDKHNLDWTTRGLWYNTSICTKLHGTVFEKYIRNTITDRYNMMYSIDAHGKQQPSYVDDGSSGDGNALSLN